MQEHNKKIFHWIILISYCSDYDLTEIERKVEKTSIHLIIYLEQNDMK